MPIVKLTQEFINNSLVCPAGKKRIEFCDKELPGLIIIVTETSSVSSFYLRYKSFSKTAYIKIARTNELSLGDARKKAKVLKLEISNGADPSYEKRIQKAVLTLSEFYQQHYKPYAAMHKRSASSDHQLFTYRIESRFGHLRLNQITKTMIIGFHNELRESGLAGATCDHYVKFLRHAFNLAIDWDLLKDINPASGVKLFNLDNKVEHYLDTNDLERLMTALKTGSNRTVCLIAMALICTGMRLGEMLTSKWSQINRETRTWKVSALNSKSRKIRSLPINDAAITLLNQLDTEGEFEYLFVNRVTGKPYTNIHKAWGKIRKEAGLPHLRIHDLRHQYASFLVNSGRTLYEVQQILGHSNSKTTIRYSHLSTATLQAAANSASVMINAAMGK